MSGSPKYQLHRQIVRCLEMLHSFGRAEWFRITVAARDVFFDVIHGIRFEIHAFCDGIRLD